MAARKTEETVGDKGWRCTVKLRKQYIHFFQWPSAGTFELSGVKGKLSRAYLLSDPKHKPLTVSQSGETITVRLPSQAPGEIATVLCLEIKG